MMNDIIRQLRDLIINAQSSDSIDQFTKLIEQNKGPNLDLNAWFYQGQTLLRETLLMAALDRGLVEYIRILVKNDADVNYKDIFGMPILLGISSWIPWDPDIDGVKKSYTKIKNLLESSQGMCDPNIRGHDEQTVLMAMCSPAHYRVIEMPETEPIMKDIFSILLDHGADRDLTDLNGQTAEHIARENGYNDMADYIRDYQPVPDTKGCHECGI